MGPANLVEESRSKGHIEGDQFRHVLRIGAKMACL